MKALSTEEFEEMKKSENDFVLIDVLSRDHFEEGHIPGAVNIPVDQIEGQAEKLLTENQKVVVYCANTGCSASDKAAEKLEEMGFRKVMDYEAGIEGWESAGHSLEA